MNYEWMFSVKAWFIRGEGWHTHCKKQTIPAIWNKILSNRNPPQIILLLLKDNRDNQILRSTLLAWGRATPENQINIYPWFGRVGAVSFHDTSWSARLCSAVEHIKLFVHVLRMTIPGKGQKPDADALLIDTALLLVSIECLVFWQDSRIPHIATEESEKWITVTIWGDYPMIRIHVVFLFALFNLQ